MMETKVETATMAVMIPKERRAMSIAVALLYLVSK
jgi:hypothetical protein